MYDQSISGISLNKALRRSDFHLHYMLRDEKIRASIIGNSAAFAAAGGWATSPLSISQLRGKNVYSLPSFSDELLIRKVNHNIRHFKKIKNPARTSIVSNLARIAAEGVAYKIYRLDVKSFFESFVVSAVLKLVDDIERLSLATKRVLRDLFRHFVADGGQGIPRGLAISSTLSELMMERFDSTLKNKPNVFFYARYVDDIILVTSGKEIENDFMRELEKLLPEGLKLSRKKQEITSVPKVDKKSATKFTFEYLGYKFAVQDAGQKETFRSVSIGIADGKVKKIKTKVVLAIRDYCKGGNFPLLVQRLQFLTANFSMRDRDRSRMRLAGIYYNYHLIDASKPNAGLDDLDRFLRSAILSGNGATYARLKARINRVQREQLLRFSFNHGFKTQFFVHYTGSNLKTIQECWKYA